MFKVGDKVRYLGGVYNTVEIGAIGVVTEDSCSWDHNSTRVDFGWSSMPDSCPLFYPHEIELVTKKFKVGDMVRYVGSAYEYLADMPGSVLKVDVAEPMYLVELIHEDNEPYFDGLWCFTKELVLAE